MVHPKGWDDVAKPDEKDSGDKDDDKKNPTAEASMFYVAYFAQNAPPGRPVTFLFNGGPGSSSVWLHMGAFGPVRVDIAGDAHPPAAPYHVVANDESLLDASDLVFIDAPGTGFSRIAGKDKEKAFYGVDQDAYAFARFIVQFLTKYDRWNAPKYIFGESYGTPRAAVLANMLEQHFGVDPNGIVMLSQILNFDLGADGAEGNPGIDLPYELSLPSYAATAWFHHKLQPGGPDLATLLPQVEHFAMTDYAEALSEGLALDPARRAAIAGKLHDYTGLPVAYLQKANLRVEGGEFEKTLQADADLTTGRLDSRFSGPNMDPLSKEADYDPQSAAIGPAYVAAFNDYARRVLKYGDDTYYKPEIDIKHWDQKHKQPGQDQASEGTPNVMPDLAAALKYNPNLKVQLNGGYFDLATPFYEGIYEMNHLPIPQSLLGNIEFKQYESGHMVYVRASALAALHDNVADFIRRTETPPAAK